MWYLRLMEMISWIERKTNEEVLKTVKGKRTFINAINTRYRKIVAYLEDLHNIIIKGMMEEKKTEMHP